MVDAGGLSPELLLRELGWVRELARSLLRNDALADDVVQETWLAASRQPAGSVQRVRPWLASIVHNQVRRLVRGRGRRAAREAAVAAAAPAASSADIAERGALYRELTEAVMALEPPYRDAVLLRYLDGLSGTEVAERLGIGHGAARQRVARGLELLRARLGTTHAGGFTAWSAAWIHQLGAATPAATAATSSAALSGVLGFVMQGKWLSAAVGGVLALGVWLAWPFAAVAPPPPPASAGDRPVAANSWPIAPAAPDAAERSVAPATDRQWTVVDAADGPAPNVHVLVLLGGDLREQSVTDAAGAFVAPTASQWDSLLLAAPARVPQRVAVPDLPASRRIVLAAGERVAGRVQLPAGASAELQLGHDGMPTWSKGLGDAALAAVATLGIAPDHVRVALPPDGTFDVRGLPRDWSGAISLANGFTLRGAAPRWRVRNDVALLLVEPTTDIELIAVPPLVVRGRLLGGGEPATDVDVALDWNQWPDDRTSTARSGADGRFTLAVGRTRDTRGMLPLVIGTRAGQLRMLELPNDAAEFDAGDIELGRPLTVHVRRPDASPIAEAEIVVQGPAGSRIAGRSGTDGRALLPFVAPDAKRVLVMAAGCTSARAAIPASGELTVELAPCSSLAIAIAAVPELLDGLRLRVQSDTLPFAAAGVDDQQAFDREFELERGGRRALDGLRPGVLLRLTVLDGQGAAMASRDVVAPPIGRCDAVEFAVAAHLSYLRGTVRDERGKPIAHAVLRLEAGDQQLRALTGTDGRFALGPLRLAVTGGHFEAQHPQFVTLVRHPFAADPEAGELDLTLLRGRDLQAIVAQAGGQPVTGAIVALTFADQASGLGSEGAPGSYAFENVAPRAGTLTVLLWGREYSAAVGADDTTAQLIVPDLATLTVPFPAGEDAAAERRISLVVTPLDPPGNGDRRYFRRAKDGVVSPLSLQLLPGRYRLRLEALVAPGRFDAVGAPREIVAVGGTVARIELQ